MSGADADELTQILHAFKHCLAPAPTSAEADAWWPLVLQIEASMSVADAASATRRQASRVLIWAVSDVIRMLKASGRPDVGRVCTALADLERQVAASQLHSRPDGKSVHA